MLDPVTLTLESRAAHELSSARVSGGDGWQPLARSAEPETVSA